MARESDILGKNAKKPGRSKGRIFCLRKAFAGRMEAFESLRYVLSIDKIFDHKFSYQFYF